MKSLWISCLLLTCCAPHPAQADCGTVPAPWTHAASPFYMAVAPSGTVYVTNTVTNTVSVYSPAGALVADWSAPAGLGGEFSPAGVAVDGAGSVYVADWQNSRVVVLNSNGEYQRSITNPGTGIGQFLIPLDITLGPDNDLFIVDLYPLNSKVVRVRLDCTFLNEWPILTQNGSYDIAVDNDGTVYGVQWPGQAPVEVRSSAGTPLRTWSPGSPGETVSTARIEVHNGTVYVSVVGNPAGTPVGQLRVFDGAGTLKCAEGLPLFGAIAAGPTRTLYVGSPDQEEVYSLTVDSTPVARSTWGALKSRYR